MNGWSAQRIAEATGGQLLSARRSAGGPTGVSIDSRTVGAGELFIGLAGVRTDGGEHAAQALAAGAWGVLVSSERASALVGVAGGGAVIAHDSPLEGLHELARRWRAELGARGAKVIGITGSTGKTSTKDILAALLAQELRVAATPANLNTEIGLPLAVLSAPADTQALVLEMAMRGPGQIAELASIADPDVGVIVNVGPAHLELLGSLEAIAAAKAELIAALRPGASAVLPAREPLLETHLRSELNTISFGEGGDVQLRQLHADGTVAIRHGSEAIEVRPSFAQAHQLQNLLAAVAAARAIGVSPRGELHVRFSAMRGQRERLPNGAVLIDDCYNANPMSMRAAIDDLAEAPSARLVAVLGDMLELGEQGPQLHRELGSHAEAAGVGLLVAVGPLAAHISQTFSGEIHTAADAVAAGTLLERLVREGDTVLVKGSRGVGLELVSERLRALPSSSAGGDTHAAAGAAPGRR